MTMEVPNPEACPGTSMGSFTDPEVQRCPFPLYTRLRSEAPVYRDPVTGFHVVTRYEDIVHVTQHPELFSNTTTQIFNRAHSPVAAEVARRYQEHGFLPMHTLVSNDPPSHTAYRALVDRAFGMSTVKSLEPMIAGIVDELIDAFEPRGKVDFIKEFANLLPLYVIAHELGLPREDHPRFKRWSDVAIEQINPVLAPDRELAITDEVIQMQQYLYRHAKAYEQNPAPKILSKLVHAEIDGRRLKPEELVNIAGQLLVAGNETTTTTLITSVHLLMEQPELRARLSAQPDLIPGFVEEVLRLHAPIPQLFRQVLEDTQLQGVPLAKGSIVLIVFGAGNRDAAKFDQADALDPERRNARQHLSFGRGIHYCIGNVLSRTELRMAIARLLQRLPALRLDPHMPAPRWAASASAHVLENLNLCF